MEEKLWTESRQSAPRDRVRASDQPELRPLFEACDRLERRVLDAVPHGQRFAPKDVRYVMWASILRSLRTFDALLLLADNGYGPQAMILARTFVEDTVAAWWVRQQDPAELFALFSAHEKSVATRLQFPASAPSDVLPTTSSLPLLLADDYKEFVASHDVDPNVAFRIWTRRSVKVMADVTKPTMRPQERDRLDQLLGQPFLLANLLTHNSPASLGTTMVAGTVFSRQPSTRLVHDALAVGYDALSLVAWLVMTEQDTVDLDQQIETDRIPFKVLPADARPGRNDPCPCGSGRKYKHCHGRQ